jgi:hypothetical protein
MMFEGAAASLAYAVAQEVGASTPKPPQNFAIISLEIVLPDSYDSPPLSPEQAHHSSISLSIALNLLYPKPPISHGNGPTPPTAMPKTPVQKNCYSILQENHVRTTSQAGVMP